jgi:hypothetical protein
VPCLIRRAAITAAFGNDPTPYALADLRAGVLNTAASEGATSSFLPARDRPRPTKPRACGCSHSQIGSSQ